MYKYKPDDFETKLIILYTISSLKSSPSYQTLSQIVTACADINYFEIESYIDELLILNSIIISKVDGEDIYSLTQSGEEMSEYFGPNIPASIREKIDESAYEINNDRSHENKIYANYLPINEHEYKVVCGIVEQNVQMLDFSMYAGSKERAKKMCEYFKDHTYEFYRDFLAVIEKNIPDSTDE